MWHSKSVVLGLCITACVLFLSPLSALAHDATFSKTFGDYTPQYQDHYDDDPWKGLVTVTITNNMAEDWGDFHFEIFPLGGSVVTNVDIVDVDPNKPTTTQNPFTYDIDNEADGATLDYYFYGDPVLKSGDIATFIFYTNNETDHANFMIGMYPSAVPEPATLVVLALGGLLLATRRN